MRRTWKARAVQFELMKRLGIIVAVVAALAVGLSLLFRIPWLYTVAGCAAWAVAGHVLTIDEDFPGGWSNPDGKEPFPWRELVLKAVVLLAVAALLLFLPSLRMLGA